MQNISLPTKLHQNVIDNILKYFCNKEEIDTILLTNSCARGKGVEESDIDIAILLRRNLPVENLRVIEKEWNAVLKSNTVFRSFTDLHPFLKIHLDFISGNYVHVEWDDGGGPDAFEVEIGNHLVYSHPIYFNGTYFEQLKQEWCPYYNENLQKTRLEMVKKACQYDIDHIPFFINRALYFQAFDRLYKAFQEFLQVLFIKYKIYPIAYNKWIREQVLEILHLSELYNELPKIISVPNIEGNDLLIKGRRLEALLNELC